MVKLTINLEGLTMRIFILFLAVGSLKQTILSEIAISLSKCSETCVMFACIGVIFVILVYAIFVMGVCAYSEKEPVNPRRVLYGETYLNS